MTRGGRASWILAIIAHVLAWVAYLPLAVGLVLWPYLQGESGEEYGVLIAAFVPVALTGLALLTVLGVRRSGGFPLLAFGARVAPLLLFIIAGLAIYTVSQFYLPWEAKVVIGLAIGGIALGPVFIGGRIVRVLNLWVAALLLLGFCVLTGFSVGVFFLPSALLSLSLATVFSFSRTVALDEE